MMQQIQHFIFDLGQGPKERGHWSNINAAKVLPKGIGICFSKLASCWYCQWSGGRPGPMAKATFIQPWQCHGMAMVMMACWHVACQCSFTNGMPMIGPWIESSTPPQACSQLPMPSLCNAECIEWPSRTHLAHIEVQPLPQRIAVVAHLSQFS